MIKIMAEINEIENREAREKSVKPNMDSLRKTNKLDKRLAGLAKKKSRGVK
jgi:hypothetical protein